MSNPWSRKNPLLSMWLSAANKGVAGARGQAIIAARRQVTLNQAEAARRILEFWSGMAMKPASVKKTRR